MTRPTICLFLTFAMATGCTAPPVGSSVVPSESIQAESAEPSPSATPAPTAPMTPPPTPVPEVLPADIDPDVQHAVELRSSYGLRYDLEYVLMVAKDPRAIDAFGVPTYPEEFTDVTTRFDESRAMAQLVQGCADAHRDEFGGLYIEESAHTGLVSLWTDHLAEHAADIRAKAGPSARLAFGKVRYAEAELRTLQHRVTKEWRAPWVARIPAAFEGVGFDVYANAVIVEISSADPDAATIVADHFGVGDRLQVESDGTGVRLIPWGTIRGRVEPIPGSHTWLDLAWSSSDSGECGGGDMGFGVNQQGMFELPCQIGTWTIKVMDHREDDTQVEIGRATVKVRKGRVTRVTIHLHT